MLPKIIHYCWFGGNPLPELAQKCIASWRQFFPDYEIKEWNESNYDVHKIPYMREAYAAKKYAFVSDYARFDILYAEGGLYFDTDVEVIKDMSDIIERGNFMGCEKPAQEGATPMQMGVAPGLGLGVNPGLGLYKKLLDIYEGMHFDRDSNGVPLYTVVDITTDLLVKEGLENTNGIQYIGGVYIYPVDYFNPISIVTKRLKITKNTRSIHHFMASWMKESIFSKIKDILRPFIPDKLLLMWNKR